MSLSWVEILSGIVTGAFVGTLAQYLGMRRAK